MKRLSLAILALALAAAVWSSASGVRAQEQHPGEYSPIDVENGSRLYTSQCITCHGPTGDGVAGIDLRRGAFKKVNSDEDLRGVILNGVPNTGMPKFAFTPAEQNAVVAYIRAAFEVGGRAVKIGDPGRGRQVFEKKGTCGSCHRVLGVGDRKGPDLTDIGAMRSASMLQLSLVDPNATLLPINRQVRAVTKDGQTINGRRLNEDTHTVQIIDDGGKLRSMNKSDLKSFEVTATATMPSFRDRLTPDEISDLVAYLLTLKG
jgi:putative heme-binding domain-containing protein